MIGSDSQTRQRRKNYFRFDCKTRLPTSLGQNPAPSATVASRYYNYSSNPENDVNINGAADGSSRSGCDF